MHFQTCFLIWCDAFLLILNKERAFNNRLPNCAKIASISWFVTLVFCRLQDWIKLMQQKFQLVIVKSTSYLLNLNRFQLYFYFFFVFESFNFLFNAKSTIIDGSVCMPYNFKCSLYYLFFYLHSRRILIYYFNCFFFWISIKNK